MNHEINQSVKLSCIKTKRSDKRKGGDFTGKVKQTTSTEQSTKYKDGCWCCDIAPNHGSQLINLFL